MSHRIYKDHERRLSEVDFARLAIIQNADMCSSATLDDVLSGGYRDAHGWRQWHEPAIVLAVFDWMVKRGDVLGTPGDHCLSTHPKAQRARAAEAARRIREADDEAFVLRWRALRKAKRDAEMAAQDAATEPKAD